MKKDYQKLTEAIKKSSKNAKAIFAVMKKHNIKSIEYNVDLNSCNFSEYILLTPNNNNESLTLI